MVSTDSGDTIALVACEVIKPEIDYIGETVTGFEAFYLRQSLHLTPKILAEKIQELIDILTGNYQRIVLGYGLCSNGIVGVSAREEEIVVPRCHDCISFFLGSPQKYLEDFRSRPGSYYLTPGWIQEGKDPLTIMKADYCQRYGEDMAEWGMKEELKHYTHIVLINTGRMDIRPFRAIGRENADYFGLDFLELPGTSLDYFQTLICGPYDDQDFFVLKPGEAVRQEFFFQ